MADVQQTVETNRQGRTRSGALNRRTQATYTGGATTTYTYDAGDRLTQLVDSVSGTISRTYDNLDRLTQEVTPQGTVSYTYDAAGRRTSMTVAGQSTVNYTYDNADRLTQVTQGTSTVMLAYDNAGRRTSLTLPSGNSVTYNSDAASRLTSLIYKQGATVLGDLTYTYDAAGNRTKIGGSFARTGLPQAVASATYNANNQQLTFGNATLTYDFNGNQTTATDPSGSATYTWDSRNRLTGITAPGLSASFVYDALGRRSSKTINGGATSLLYDGVNPVQELSGATPVANLMTGLGIDEYFMRTDTAGSSALLTDALGSTLALADNTGTVQTSYTYEAFGNTSVSGAASSNSFQYTGRESDGTGLYYYRARYYHPRLQRFISEDPLRLLAGPNSYAYVHNNPLNFKDPAGLFLSPWHFYITYTAMRATDHGILDSLGMAWNSMGPDYVEGALSAGRANEHGSGRPDQSPAEAARGVQNYVDQQLGTGTSQGLANALHDVQDLVAEGHGVDKVWDGFQWSDLLTGDFWNHLYHDAFPSDASVDRAIQNSIDLLNGSPPLDGRKSEVDK